MIGVKPACWVSDRCALRAPLAYCFPVASRFLCKVCANTRGQIPDMEAESNLTIFNNKAGDDSNFHPAARVYSLLCLFMKPNLFIIILANRGTRWGFMSPRELFVWRTFWGGTIKVQQLADQIVVIPNRQRSLSMRPLPSPPLPAPPAPGRELWGGGEKKNFFRKRKTILKRLIATRMPYVVLLWAPSNNVSAVECAFGDVCTFGEARAAVDRRDPADTLHKTWFPFNVLRSPAFHGATLCRASEGTARQLQEPAGKKTTKTQTQKDSFKPLFLIVCSGDLKK